MLVIQSLEFGDLLFFGLPEIFCYHKDVTKRENRPPAGPRKWKGMENMEIKGILKILNFFLEDCVIFDLPIIE